MEKQLVQTYAVSDEKRLDELLYGITGEGKKLIQQDGASFRPCGDYRALNTVTKPDQYPLPDLHDCTAQLAGCDVFSIIDINRPYCHIPMSEEDIAKTAITTQFGLYEFVRMPFGLKNMGKTFQRFMDTIFRNVPFAFAYADGIYD